MGDGQGRNTTAKPANRWTTAAYEQHCEENLPSAKDKELLLDIIRNEKKWIKEKEGARDPLSTIGEPRKSAINI